MFIILSCKIITRSCIYYEIQIGESLSEYFSKTLRWLNVIGQTKDFYHLLAIHIMGQREEPRSDRPVQCRYMYKQYCGRVPWTEPQLKLILLPSDRFSNNKHEILTEPFFCLTFRDFRGWTLDNE
jgi:hypothetical protein